MNCITLRRSARPGRAFTSGYVLFDVLTAMLVFATVLMAGGLTLIQSMAASRAASLQTIAVDLAADLTESLQVVAQDPPRLAQWQSAVRERLPSASADLLPADGSPTAEIDIQWREHADAATARLRLPVPPPPQDSEP